MVDETPSPSSRLPEQELATRTPFLTTLLHLPLKKLLIWAGFGALLYILRDFFPLIFLTFVLSYISATLVSKFEHKFSNRVVPIVVFFLALIGGLVGFSWLAIPQITREARVVRDDIKRAKGLNNFLDEKLKSGLGEETYGRWTEDFGVPPPDNPDGEKSLSRAILGKVSHETTGEYLALLLGVGKEFWKSVAFLVLSIVFSFLLVLSLPTFKDGVRELEHSRIRDIYLEVAPSITTFGRLVGRALEAQTFIALANTTITAIGMWLLSIPHFGLLSVGVFVCSFIPVAGVWISTTPIALVAVLMQNGGAGKLVGVIAMVSIAHFFEAYVLNPRIYGYHMKMNPLAVLFVLFLAENLVGVWGLVVAVPLTTYVWKFVILGLPDSDSDEAPPSKPPALSSGASEAPPAPKPSEASPQPQPTSQTA